MTLQNFSPLMPMQEPPQGTPSTDGIRSDWKKDVLDPLPAPTAVEESQIQ